jgi:hypothetical protein
MTDTPWQADTERTRCVPLDLHRRMSSLESERAAVAWTEELDRLARLRAHHDNQEALAVITSTGGPFPFLRGQIFFGDGEPMSVSIGRHPACAVNGVRGASLRHAVALLWPSQERSLEIIDLRSGAGIGDARIRARSAARFRVGHDEITVLYASPGDRFPELPDELDGWIEVEAEEPSGEHQITNCSVVTRLRDGTYSRVADGVRLGARGTAYVRTSARELRRGLLLGRYERCDRAWIFENDHGVSRVHALLIERRGELFVIDVGSTNGTRIFDWGTGDVRLELLEDHYVHRLGDDEGVELAARRVVIELAGRGADSRPRSFGGSTRRNPRPH